MLDVKGPLKLVAFVTAPCGIQLWFCSDVGLPRILRLLRMGLNKLFS